MRHPLAEAYLASLEQAAARLRHARRVGGNPRTGTSAIVLGGAAVVVPVLLWSVLFSTRSESHVDSTEVFPTETVPVPSSTTAP